MNRALAARLQAGENGERDPHHERESSYPTAAPAEDSPVCDCQTLSLINQAKQRGFTRY